MNSTLVLNVTNYVAMNFSANVLLAAGASPIMSFFPEEMEELVRRCDALVINIGCLDAQFMEGAERAAKEACAWNIPWVLDPAGVGASSVRKSFCHKLIQEYHPAIIRANASEVECLRNIMDDTRCNGCDESGRGVDATVGSEETVEAAKALARHCGCVVSMSGESDFITDGKELRRIDGGSPIMPMVTAMGCSASALTAAYAAVAGNPMEAAVTAMTVMAEAGEKAAAAASLPGTFQAAFLDALAGICGSCRTGRRFRREMLKLYLVTDRGLAGNRSIEDIVTEAAEGGATMVQLREKSIDTSEFIELAVSLKKALEPYGVPLIINDRVDVALAAGADGVHIGQSDMPYSKARRLLGPDRIIGLSVENMEQVEEANGMDVDYIGISPVFATPTKTDTAAPFGLDGLAEAVSRSVHPAVGIGGMNASTASGVMKAGADGIAVVSAIVCSPDPKEAAAELLKIVNDNE